MMKRIHILLPLCLALVAALASCIREELQPCPPLSVKIGIEDKNYVNIDEVAQLTGGLVSRLDENLPFRSYIQKLYYSLYSIDSAKVVLTRHLHEVQGDAKEATAYLPEDLGFGEYVLVVWGNIDSEDGIQRNGAAYDLHTGHVAGYDVYMTCDTLLYEDTHYDYTVMLERVKGQLLIEAKKLPANIRRSRKAVSRVHGGVDYRFRYEGGEGEYLVTDYDLEELTVQQGHALSRTAVAPTLDDEEDSGLYLRFFDDADAEEPVRQEDNLPVLMERNKITYLQYLYDNGAGEAEVRVWLDDHWEVLHNLSIEK